MYNIKDEVGNSNMQSVLTLNNALCSLDNYLKKIDNRQIIVTGMNMPGHLGKILSINEKLLYILMKMKKKVNF